MRRRPLERGLRRREKNEGIVAVEGGRVKGFRPRRRPDFPVDRGGAWHAAGGPPRRSGESREERVRVPGSPSSDVRDAFHRRPGGPLSVGRLRGLCPTNPKRERGIPSLTLRVGEVTTQTPCLPVFTGIGSTLTVAST